MKFAAAALLAFALSACASTTQTQAPPEEAAAAQPAVDPLAHPERFAGDAENDARRKAAETLAFFQIGAGDFVFEIEAGGGYWTEIFSRAVGPSGAVVMQNPAGFMRFVGEQVQSRLAEGRLGNVRPSLSNFDALDALEGTVDVVTWVQGPHELFFRPDGGSLGDPATSYEEIFRILKAGGVFAVVDHSAPDGAPSSTGNDTHRIDPAIVIAMAEAAGFTLEARGAFLANPEDARTANVFDPAIRGRTDQFALRFRKPG